MSTTRRRSLGLGMMVLALAAVAGCDKEVEVTFTNTTSNSLELTLMGPGSAEYIGTLGLASTLQTKIKVDEDSLPAKYRWIAGDRSGRFTITEDSKSKLLIRIEPGGTIGPFDKDTTIQKGQKIEIKDAIID